MTQIDFPTHWGNRRHFDFQDGYWLCILCNKWSSEEHVRSIKHQRKLEWEDWQENQRLTECHQPELTLQMCALPLNAGDSSLHLPSQKKKQGRNKISSELQDVHMDVDSQAMRLETHGLVMDSMRGAQQNQDKEWRRPLQAPPNSASLPASQPPPPPPKPTSYISSHSSQPESLLEGQNHPCIESSRPLAPPKPTNLAVSQPPPPPKPTSYALSHSSPSDSLRGGQRHPDMESIRAPQAQPKPSLFIVPQPPPLGSQNHSEIESSRPPQAQPNPIGLPVSQPPPTSKPTSYIISCTSQAESLPAGQRQPDIESSRSPHAQAKPTSVPCSQPPPPPGPPPQRLADGKFPHSASVASPVVFLQQKSFQSHEIMKPPSSPRLELTSGIRLRIPQPPISVQPFSQNVPVLLHQRLHESKFSGDRKYTVGVMGLHRSGTHALIEYIKRFFDVDCEPQHRKSYGDGTLILEKEFRIWKHAVPLGPWNLPPLGNTGGPVIIFLLVRDVMSWMTSLSNHAYEIFPVCRCKRAKGQLWWMLNEVEVSTSTGRFSDPFPDSRFDSVPALWVAYVQGYLSAAMSGPVNSSSPTFIIVRYEDIVQRPHDVIQEITRLGLPRNQVPFTPIGQNVSSTGPHEHGRDALIANITEDRAAKRFATEPTVRDRLREELKAHSRLFELLGYTAP